MQSQVSFKQTGEARRGVRMRERFEDAMLLVLKIEEKPETRKAQILS